MDGKPTTTTTIFEQVFRELRPRTPMPRTDIEFRPFTGITNTIEWSDGVLRARISDLLSDAPESVMEALAWILLCKMLRKPVAARFRDRYRRYLNRTDVVEAAEKARRERGRKHLVSPQGRFFDLTAIFEEINFRYFHGLMAQPALGWTPRPSRSILGHYDPAHHAIVLSQALDRERVPKLVVEYVMYHEMLHLRHPVQRVAGRRCVHTEEFRKAEEQFERLEEATDWLETKFGRS